MEIFLFYFSVHTFDEKTHKHDLEDETVKLLEILD